MHIEEGYFRAGWVELRCWTAATAAEEATSWDETARYVKGRMELRHRRESLQCPGCLEVNYTSLEKREGRSFPRGERLRSALTHPADALKVVVVGGGEAAT